MGAAFWHCAAQFGGLAKFGKNARDAAKLSGYFDHILIDSPPITSVTDPILLSRMVDGVVMVIHGGKSSREMVAYARQELHNVGAKILGVVLNNVNLARDGYDYYYYRRYQYEYKRDAGDNGNLNRKKSDRRSETVQ